MVLCDFRVIWEVVSWGFFKIPLWVFFAKLRVLNMSDVSSFLKIWMWLFWVVIFFFYDLNRVYELLAFWNDFKATEEGDL